jgi:FkbM family methyltransferase
MKYFTDKLKHHILGRFTIRGDNSKNSKADLQPGIDFKNIDDEVSYIKNLRNNIGYFFPYSRPLDVDQRQLWILNNGFHHHYMKKYSEQDVSIHPGDTVVDCGAFVGGFSVAAACAGASNVISIEPSQKNFRCLKLNLALYGIHRATPLNIALGNTCSIAKLNLSKSGCDDSLTDPDEGALNITQDVQIETITSLVDSMKISSENLYFKVEAEGFEPEVIDGLGACRPKVVVVDVTPERWGESPRESVFLKLKALGYKTFINKERCLFAVR